LKGEPIADAPGFHNVEMSPECEGNYGFLAVLSGWEEMPGGGIRLIGAEGSTMGEFKADARGVFHAKVINDGNPYVLTPQAVFNDQR
jgi:hypothetical protein